MKKIKQVIIKMYTDNFFSFLFNFFRFGKQSNRVWQKKKNVEQMNKWMDG